MLPDHAGFLHFTLPAEQSFCQTRPYVPSPQKSAVGTPWHCSQKMEGSSLFKHDTLI